MDFIYRTEFERVKILFGSCNANFFIDFHQGPPRTIWLEPRRPLHKWSFLKPPLSDAVCLPVLTSTRAYLEGSYGV